PGAGRPAAASSTEWQYVAANATDDDTSTDGEGAGGEYPSTLTVSLDAAAELTPVVVKHPPAAAWGPRTQTFEVQGRESAAGAWQTRAASAARAFSPGTGNSVTVPVTGTAKDVRLRLTGNTGPGNGQVAEQDESNNADTNPAPLAATAVPSPDLVPTVTWSPTSPAAGSTVTFSATLANQGNVATSAGAHGLTVTVTNTATGAVVRTLTGSVSGAIAAGASSASVSLGTWTAADGTYDVQVVAAPDPTAVAAKQANNAAPRPLFVGRGANLPFDTYEAEDGVTGGGATVLAPNRVVGDLAGEASGRRAVTLDQTGAYVEWTTKAPTTTLLTRFSIPDAAGGGGTDATLAIFVDGQFLKNIDLTSRYAWLYGNETNPGNQPGQGAPRHVYDEASTLLGTTVPAGSTIRLQKTAQNTSQYAIDFVDLELATPQANPDPERYTQPTGFTHQDVQDALDRVRMDTTGTLDGVYLPA